MKQSGKSGAQRDDFALELLKLEPDITAKDRQAAMEKLAVSRFVISTYLNGQVRDNDTAAELILFFKACIARRNLVLLQLPNQMAAAHV